MNVESIANEGAMKRSRSKPRISVAEYITQQIKISGKTNIEIAEEVGFPKSNVISMLKNGATKLPLAKVGKMAKALGVDPIHLFKLAMQEYEPDTWEALEHGILNQPLITTNEMEIINIVRSANVENPKIRTLEERRALLGVVQRLRPDGSA